MDSQKHCTFAAEFVLHVHEASGLQVFFGCCFHFPFQNPEVYGTQACCSEIFITVATLAIQPPGMGTALDSLNHAQSLTSRRPAASNLPNFDLPNPQISHIPNTSSQKAPSLLNTSASQSSPANAKLGSLLTPPLNSSSENTNPLPGLATSGSVPSPSHIVPPYSQNYWQNTSSYNFGSGKSCCPGTFSCFKTVFSSSIGSGRNNPGSPDRDDPLPPSYDMHHMPSFQSVIPSSSGPPGSSTIPQQPQHPAMTNSLMSAQATVTPVSPSQPHPQSSAMDAYGQKLPQAPLYSGPKQPTAPQQPNYAPFQPGVSGGAQRMSPISVQMPPDGQYTRPYPSYSLPAMPGPVMTNVHNPNGQMAMMGSVPNTILPGYNSGHAVTMHQIYNSGLPHPHHLPGLMQPGPSNDRPFRCDVCPQSFNRNHDLKRHKRIHLSVKPFPCGHCDKSFSRKDALKVLFPEKSIAIAF